MLMGIAAGYASSRSYKFFKGKSWQKCTLATAMFFPSVCFTIFFVLNLFVWGEGSVRAVPFGSMLALIALWFGISVPLVFLGARRGAARPGRRQERSAGRAGQRRRLREHTIVKGLLRAPHLPGRRARRQALPRMPATVAPTGCCTDLPVALHL